MGINSRLIAALAVLSLISCSPPAPPDGPQDFSAIVEPYVEIGDFSGVVYVARGEDVQFARAWGQADRERHQPNTVGTSFLIGSMAKQFTAAAILLLHDDGRLDPTDSLARFLPDYPRADEITLFQLLTHTAGVPDIFELPQYRRGFAGNPPLAQIVAWLGVRPLKFDPGSAYLYSNGGYLLLAAVIEVASGVPFEEFLQKRIFSTLGMSSSGVLPVTGSNLALGYDPAGSTGFTPAPDLGATWLHGSGSVYANAPDLHRWDQALHGDTFLSAASRQQMFTDHGNGYGFGVSVFELFGETVIEHDGRIAGYASDIARYVKSDTVVILLSNVQSVARDRIRDDIGALLLGREPRDREQRPIQVRPADPQRLQLLAGQYAFGPGINVEVRAAGATLYLRGNEGAESEFFPVGDNRFFSRTLYTFISFDLSGDESVAMDFMPPGSKFRGERVR